MMRMFMMSCCLSTIAISFVASRGSAATVADYTFDHLDGVAPGGIPNDAVRAEDESGNRFHGFYGGGAGNAPARLDGVSPGQITPTGTSGLDFSNTGNGRVILRDGLASGTNNFAFGAGNTPSPYFTIGASESWTIEAIINFQNAGDNEAIIANNGTGSEWWWRTDTTGNGLQFHFDNASNLVSAAHGNNLINNDGWHHVALVFDRTADEVCTYYGPVTGGTLVGTTSMSASFGAVGIGTRDIEIGQFDGVNTRDFDGFLDRLVITNEALGPGSFAAALTIPEPTSFALFFTAVFGLGFVCRRSARI